MRLKIDLTGMMFGRWTVVGEDGRAYAKNHIMWRCKCECGNTARVLGSSLRGGSSRSCGCLNKGCAFKHGMSTTLVYSSWRRMKGRCYDPKDKSFGYYGGRGIGVCDHWLNSFENFFRDMGEPPSGMTLDRIDNNKSYSPENCRWAAPKTQRRNVRNNVLITFHGEIKCLSEWVELFGLSYGKTWGKLRAGLPVEEVLSK